MQLCVKGDLSANVGNEYNKVGVPKVNNIGVRTIVRTSGASVNEWCKYSHFCSLFFEVQTMTKNGRILVNC